MPVPAAKKPAKKKVAAKKQVAAKKGSPAASVPPAAATTTTRNPTGRGKRSPATSKAKQEGKAKATPSPATAASKAKQEGSGKAKATLSPATAASKAKQEGSGKAKATPSPAKKKKKVRNLAMMLEMEKMVDEGNSCLHGAQPQTDALAQKLAAVVKRAEEIDVATLDPLDMAAKLGLDGCLPAWKASLAQRAFTPSAKVWAVKVAQLKAAVERCVTMYGKTPLVIDNAESSASTYFKYTAGVTLDAKAAVVQRATKAKTLEEVQDDMRKKVVVAMQMGYPLIIELRNSAPDFRGQLCSDTTLPLDTLVMERFAGFNGKADVEYFSSGSNTEAFHDKMAQPGTDEQRDLKHARTVGRHTSMYPVLVTQFDVEDYEEFLSTMLPPMDRFQAIHVLNT